MAVVAVAVMAGASLGAVPQAQADGGPGATPVMANESDTGELMVNKTASSGIGQLVGGLTIRHTGLGMYAKTRPAVAVTSNRYEASFEANTGHLWVTAMTGPHDLSLPTFGGTSPHIVTVSDGDYDRQRHSTPSDGGAFLPDLSRLKAVQV